MERKVEDKILLKTVLCRHPYLYCPYNGKAANGLGYVYHLSATLISQEINLILVHYSCYYLFCSALPAPNKTRTKALRRPPPCAPFLPIVKFYTQFCYSVCSRVICGSWVYCALPFILLWFCAKIDTVYIRRLVKLLRVLYNVYELSTLNNY